MKKRIVRIMTRGAASKLDRGKKFLLGAAGFLAVAVPVVFGLSHRSPSIARSQPQNTTASASDYKYDVAKIRPNKSGARTNLRYSPDGITATSVPLRMLIRQAYGLKDFQILAGPNWINSEYFDVEAKMDGSVAAELQKLSPDRRWPVVQQMLRKLLGERFNLTIHRETKELPVYALVIAKSGLKIQEAKAGDANSDGLKGPSGSQGSGAWFVIGGRGEPQTLTAKAVPLTNLVDLLSQETGRTVLDRTGLTGKYDFVLKWTTDVSQAIPGGDQSDDSAPPPESSGPAIFTATQEQLGLKLESTKGPVEVIVIDHAEKPSGN